MDITINGNAYRSVKLDAFKQFHVARRLAPVVFALGSAATNALKAPSVLQDDAAAMDAVISAAGPVADVFAAMSDADSQYILTTCLSTCSRQSNVGWQPIVNANGAFQFDDIDLPTMMQIAIAVIRENIGNFMPALAIAK
jgi:hypothetical protein